MRIELGSQKPTVHTNSLRYLRRRSSNNCYLQRFDKIMSMDHARRRYLRSDRTVGCVEVSSALSRCARCLAQKHVKKQNLCIENNNSGPTITTRPWLSFITAIFVASFSGALAEELMAMCRYATTEFYIYR